jgi:hypothetical protein
MIICTNLPKCTFVRTSQGYIEKLKHPAKKGKKSSSEDERNDACEGDCGGPGSFPLSEGELQPQYLAGQLWATYAQETVQQGMVVCNLD